MSNRKIESRARILALQALYAKEQQSLRSARYKQKCGSATEKSLGFESPKQCQNYLAQFCDVLEFSWLDRVPINQELFMARLLVKGVCGNSEEIDELIAENLENWSVERLLVLDRTVLRLGCYMLKYSEDTPTKVVIDECIELCHSFSSEQSYRLVNGVLHSVVQQLRSTAKV